jgi:hypothetical protein
MIVSLDRRASLESSLVPLLAVSPFVSPLGVGILAICLAVEEAVVVRMTASLAPGSACLLRTAPVEHSGQVH